MIAAHGSGAVPGAWDLDPLVLATAAVTLFLYARGTRKLEARRSARAPSSARQTCFYAGLLGAVGALVSPLHGWSETLFAAHMTQHLVLMVIAGPLLVLGRPTAPFLAGLPGKIARFFARAHSAPRKHAPAILHPVALWVVSTIVLWAWHLPTLYDAALDNEALHALEHATFVGTALLVWGAVLGEHPIGEGASVLLLFATALQSGALGALLTFAGSVLYQSHQVVAPAAGFDPLVDQQLAGVIMWIPSGIVYLAAMAFMLARLLRTEVVASAEEGRP